MKLLGNRLFMAEKSKVDKTHEVKRSVRVSMRMLTRLYFEFRKVFQEITQEEFENIEDMFMGENFHVLSRVVDKITQKDGDEIKYGLKYNFQYLIQSTAETLKGEYLMSPGEETKVTEVSYFLEILALNKHSVFGDATYHINKSRQEKIRLPSRMPEEEDLQKLRNFTITEIYKKKRVHPYWPT